MSEDGGAAARRAIEAWAAWGTMSLTGRADGPPLGPPQPLVPALVAVGHVVEGRSAGLGRAVQLDPLGLLSERAAIARLRRQGTVSCGGATRLLASADGWVAVSLARDEDVELCRPGWAPRRSAPVTIRGRWSRAGSRRRPAAPWSSRRRCSACR